MFFSNIQSWLSNGRRRRWEWGGARWTTRHLGRRKRHGRFGTVYRKNQVKHIQHGTRAYRRRSFRKKELAKNTPARNSSRRNKIINQYILHTKIHQ